MPAPPDLIDYAWFESVYGEADSTKINTLIPIISDQVRRFCKKSFYNADYTEYHSIKHSESEREIFLKQYPVNSITTIHDDPDRAYGSSYLLASSNYILEHNLGIITLDPRYRFNAGLNDIKVVYNAGYGAALTDLPPSLKNAVAKWVAIELKRYEGDNVGVQATIAGDVKTTYDWHNPPDEVRPALVRFQRKIV